MTGPQHRPAPQPPNAMRYYRLAALAAGPAYFALVAAAAAVGSWSEAAKLRRGAYTDTFSPTVFLELLTLPGSWIVGRRLPTYPPAFDADVYQHVVSDRTHALLQVGLLQAPLMSLFVLLVIVNPWLRRRPYDGRL